MGPSTTTDDTAATTQRMDISENSDNLTELRQRLSFARNHRKGSPSPAVDKSQPTSPTGRKSSMRTESLRSNSSSYNARPSNFRQSTEDLLSPRAIDEDDDDEHSGTSLWYSVPLILAIVPAVGGVAFKGGSVLFTDLTLLALSSIYLNWFLVAPW